MKISAKDYIGLLNASFNFYRERAAGVNFVLSYCANSCCESHEQLLPWLRCDAPYSCLDCDFCNIQFNPHELLKTGEKNVR